MRRAAAVVAAFAMAFAGVVAVPGAATALDVGAWQYNPTTGHYYRLVDNLTWVQAESYAVSLGGHLVTINGQAEQTWLEATFRQFDPNYPQTSDQPYLTLWIGMNDRAVEGTWVWSSGEPVTYTNWLPGEPNNYVSQLPGDPYQGEDAAVINYTDPLGNVGWNDLPENHQHDAIVEVTALPRGPVGGMVTGTYHYFNFDDPTNPARERQVSVSARGTDPLSGRWSLTRPDLKASISGDVTCMVVDGNQAWVAGRITKITKIENVDPAIVGEGVLLWVRDGAATGVPDRAYSWIGDPGQPLAEMEAWCLSKSVSMWGFAGGFTVDRGDVTVKPGG